MRYESLLDDFELVVGDSSEVYMLQSPNVPSFSGTTADPSSWECHMAITEDLEDDSPLLVRPVPLNEELLNEDGTVKEEGGKYFVVQITPEESALMTYDIKYWFVVQVKNDELGYKQELIQCRLKAKKQGIFR
jgi:hypothetical protein